LAETNERKMCSVSGTIKGTCRVVRVYFFLIYQLSGD